MDSSLKAKFERLGRVKGADPVPSGLPATIAISLAGDLSEADAIPAMRALVRRRASLLHAKRAVEAAMHGGAGVVEASTVEDRGRVVAELLAYGFAVEFVGSRPINVRALRERLELTQEQFALRFGLELDAIRNWEHGRREPDQAAKSYLTVIDHDPEGVQKALRAPAGGPELNPPQTAAPASPAIPARAG